MMYGLVLAAALAPAADPAAPSGLPPQQALAIIDGEGTLRITQASCACYGPGAQQTEVDAFEKKGTDKVPVKVKVKLTSVTLTTVELPAKYVEAYTVEGTPIAREKLADLLAKERTVLVATDGQKVDPFHLQLYKDGTIVLVPPANVFGGGFNQFPVPGPPVEAVPIPLPPPLEKLPPKEPPPDKKP